MRTTTVHPYLLQGCWVFDDERTGLKEEAFVRGASEMISRLVEAKGIAGAARGFAMTFAAEPFPGHDVELSWVSRGEGDDGNDYAGVVAGQPMTCWLCPALELYFEAAPRVPPAVSRSSNTKSIGSDSGSSGVSAASIVAAHSSSSCSKASSIRQSCQAGSLSSLSAFANAFATISSKSYGSTTPPSTWLNVTS